MASIQMEEIDNVGLAHILVENSNPINLFKTWWDVANGKPEFMSAQTMNLATVSKEGRVTNRTVLLQDYDDDGFLFNTDRNGRKFQEIKDHPQVALTFLLIHPEGGKQVQRQIRVEGIATELDDSYAEKQFQVTPMHHKVRSLLCKQGEEVEWNALKERLDTLKSDLKSKKQSLRRGDGLVAYKVLPDRMEFYEASTSEIADRLVFNKKGESWTYIRLET